MMLITTLQLFSNAVIPAVNETASTNSIIEIKNLTIVTKQSTSEEITSKDVLTAIAPMAAAAGLIFTGFTYLQNIKNQKLQLLKELQDEIATLEKSDERTENYPVFAVQYLNSLDRIAYMALKKLTSDKIASYFEENFKAALAILDMPQFKKYEKTSNYLKEWCDKKGFKPSKAP